MTKKILIGVGVAFVLFIILIIATGGSDDQNTQQNNQQNEEAYLPPSIQSADTSNLQSQEENVKISPENIATGNQTTELVKAQITNYKLPTPSGKWQTCVLSRVNSLDNVQLLSFYEWFQSLSPYASEESRTVAIARKLGCPEPIIKSIPAKTELIKSWSGTGPKTLETISDVPLPWQVTGTWFMKETLGSTDAEAPYGVLLCEPNQQYETCSLLAAGFFSPRTSGNFYGASDQYTALERFYLKIETNPSDPNSSWAMRLETVLEPAKTVIE